MTEVSLRFEFGPGVDAESAAREIRDALAGLDVVETATARAEQPKAVSLAEVGAVVSVGIVIVKGLPEVLDAVSRIQDKVIEIVEKRKAKAYFTKGRRMVDVVTAGAADLAAVAR